MSSKLFEVKARAWVITFAILITCHLSLVTSTAQTFTQQVQKNHAGEGTVTIHHDADIDRLVNGSSPAKATTVASTGAKEAKKAEKPAADASATHAHAATSAPAPKKEAGKAVAKAEKPKAEAPKVKAKEENAKAKAKESTTKAKPKEEATKAKPHADTTHCQEARPVAAVPASPALEPQRTDADTAAVPTVRRGYKTTGYRVQAFAGGNTRKDRQKAERTGNAMRQLMPGEDVYVRFYAPRWVCRVGNYRTYEEAHEKLLMIRKMGYETATIVKGKIIVYNP